MKIFLRLFTVFLLSLLILSCKEESNPATTNEEHLEPEGWLITDSLSNPVLHVWEGSIATNWNNQSIQDTIFLLRNTLSTKFIVNLLDGNKNIMDLSDDEDLTFGWMISDTNALKLKHTAKWEFYLEGVEGSANIELQILHSGHVDVRTPQIPVVIKTQTDNN